MPHANRRSYRTSQQCDYRVTWLHHQLFKQAEAYMGGWQGAQFVRLRERGISGLIRLDSQFNHQLMVHLQTQLGEEE